MKETSKKQNEVEFLESIIESLCKIDFRRQDSVVTGLVLMALNRIEGRLSVIGDKP